MCAATVVNKHKEKCDVYIGRGSVWGNPFVMQNPSTKERERVIKEYRNWLWNQLLFNKITPQQLVALDGKKLGCYCAPLPCHGDVLVKAIEWAKEVTLGTHQQLDKPS